MNKELDKCSEEQDLKKNIGFFEKYLDERDLRRYRGLSLSDKVVLLHNGVDSTAMKLLCLRDLEDYIRAPTQEEVCKALSEYLGKEIKYLDGSFIDNSSNEIVAIGNLGGIYFEDFLLPSHLITLIGRFYEGVIENGNNKRTN